MKKTIVMIHGMWGGGWHWENFKRYFEQKGYACHAPTLRYHDMDPEDPPPPGLGGISLKEYARDLERYIRCMGAKPIIMGHSMGGLLAQMLAAKGLAQGLILLTPASPAGINALKFSVIKCFFNILVRPGFWHNPHRISFKSAVYAFLHLLSPSEQKQVYEKMVYESGKAATEIGFWLFDLNRASHVDESQVTCPVLVVSGAQDRITPVSVVKKVAAKYKKVSTYKEFENHAHWVVGEPGWEKIAAYVHDWINQTGL